MKAGFIRYQVPVILWGLIIFIASSIPGEDFPNYGIFSHDTLLHFAVFFVFALLLLVALRHQKASPFVSRHTVLITFIITLLYGALDELHQFLVPGRSPDWRDLLADAVGGIAAIFLFRLVERMRGARTAR